MREPFSNLELEKQQRIINASLQEFADHGYEQASTNRIVKEAGIGKGMLFYYFKSKKELYYYLIELSVDFTMKEYLHKIDVSETDFIERYRRAGKLKMGVYQKNPHVFHFLGKLYIEQELELPEELAAKLAHMYKEGYAKIYDNFDRSLFREDMKLQEIFKMIGWMMAGYEQESIKRLQGQKLSAVDYDPFLIEFNAYLDIWKKLFYK